MKYVDLIIFDLDGTLVDSKEDIADAINFMLEKLGLKKKNLDTISSYIGTGMRDLIKKSLGEDHEALADKALSVFVDYYKGHFADKSALYPGVKETLEYFKGKQKIIITNRNYDFAVSLLKALGIYKYFESVKGGDDTGCSKPLSCPLDTEISRLGMEKDRAVMVGDMDIDILAGKAAGVTTCAVTYGIGKKEDIEKSGPDYIIDDIKKLKNIIK